MVNDSMLGLSLENFASALASKAPVPGGGGASALAGALGAALAGMVCGLTSGKRRYAAFEPDIQRITAEAAELREALLREIDGDAEAFKPLSEAYSIPKDDPRRGEVMEAALAAASEPPMRMMELACRTLDLLSELREKCSVLAISDVGVGALLAVAALRGASLNVVINIKSMADRDAAGALRARVDAMLGKYVPLAEEIYLAVTEKIS